MTRCKGKSATTSKLCKRQASDGSNYCWQHCSKKHKIGGRLIEGKSKIVLPKKGVWTIYGRGTTCGWTKAAVQYLMQSGVPFTFHDTDSMAIYPQDAVKEIKIALGNRVPINYSTVPIIFDRNAKFIGGFSDLKAILQ